MTLIKEEEDPTPEGTEERTVVSLELRGPGVDMHYKEYKSVSGRMFEEFVFVQTIFWSSTY